LRGPFIHNALCLVMFGAVFDRFAMMMLGLQMVAMGELNMVRGLLIMTGLICAGRFLVMLGSMERGNPPTAAAMAHCDSKLT
jgi:hypothetical protein